MYKVSWILNFFQVESFNDAFRIFFWGRKRVTRRNNNVLAEPRIKIHASLCISFSQFFSAFLFQTVIRIWNPIGINCPLASWIQRKVVCNNAPWKLSSLKLITLVFSPGMFLEKGNFIQNSLNHAYDYF